MVGSIIFWISWPSNLVAKNAFEFSGSLIESSVSIVKMFYLKMPKHFGKWILYGAKNSNRFKLNLQFSEHGYFMRNFWVEVFTPSKSAIVLVLFQAPSKDLKANVALNCQQKLLEFFKKKIVCWRPLFLDHSCRLESN